jgi:hypothetical protein
LCGLYIRIVKLVRGIPVLTSILRPLVGASSSSSSASTSNQDSFDDYPEIGTSVCGEPTKGGHLILMVALNKNRSHNNSSRYPTIGRSEALDAQTPSAGFVQNLNPDFNVMQVQAIMETIQWLAPDGSPLRRRTSSSHRSRPVFPRENLPSATMIEQGMPEVKLHLQPVQIAIWLSTMHDGASLRTTQRGNTVVIGTTSATSSKIECISDSEHHLHHDDL